MSRRDRRANAEMREVAARAVRRLNVLEYVILGVAALLAMAAGFLVALLFQAALDFPHRATWTVASLVFFVVPAALAYLRARRSEAEEAGRGPSARGKAPGKRRERDGG